jgi:hypothetical protein
MNISIDGQPLEESRVIGQNLEEILGELQDNHLAQDRLIGDVLLNGRTYSEDIPHAAVEVTRSDINTLDLVTHTAEEVAHHFIRNSGGMLGDLVESLPRITEVFRVGDEEEANEHFLRFLESLHLFLNMVEWTAVTMGITFDASAAGNGSLNQRMLRISEVLTQLISIQEQTDWVFLADVLEYELAPELEELRTALPELLKSGH